LQVAAVIPARYGSSRFPGKPLALLHGRPMIVHVCERAAAAETVDRIWVATDDERIATAVRAAGFEARMTPSDCASGSDRIWASLGARGITAEGGCATTDPSGDSITSTSTNGGERDAPGILVNVQGDEPTIEPGVIDAVVRALIDAPMCGVATAVVPILDRAEFESPHVVKAVLRADGRALYFSRSPLPSPARLGGDPDGGVWGLKHLGLYAWRRETLAEFAGWPPSALETRECLEQLRLLERGVEIQAAIVAHDSIGVDTPEELARLNAEGGVGAQG
jgi:3-deoxy-manno-octulosonate cytidylyltransferase (CMP-KDO synthetase)